MVKFKFIPLALLTVSNLYAKVPLEANAWAKKDMVKNLVSISVDDNGDVYVSETTRRKAADLDIRQHRDWIPNDVSFQTIEDKRNFYHRELSPQHSKKNSSWLIDHNQDGSHDWKDLKVLKDKIYILKDKDQDDKADSIQVFSDDLGEEASGIAAGVLVHAGEVYTTIAPDVFKMKDSNKDGKYDQKTSIAHGFGLHIAYAGHDMHGLTVGPDGRVYWTIGDKGVSVVDQNGKRHHYPNQGAVLRCNPDGSDFKVFAHGLRNVQEIAFDEFGNMFGVDNDSDRRGELERFVYITEDSDSGWRCNYQYRGADYNPWMEERLWETHHKEQAAYITPPIQHYKDGPTGFTYNPGTALSKSYENHFFMTMFPKKTIMAFKVTPNGAGFEMKESEAVYKGINLTGLCFGPDGKLWASDWGGGYPLNDAGGIWNFDVKNNDQHPLREDTQRWLNKDYSSLSPSELISGINHSDQRVRLKAQFELAERQLTSELSNIALSDNSSLLGRIHAIWGIGQILRQQKSSDLSKTLITLLHDKNTELRAQSLRIIADIPSKTVDSHVILPLFSDQNSRVRFFAAKAIAKHPAKKQELLIQELEKLSASTKQDTFLRHALIVAMTGALNELTLAELSQHSNEQLKLMAVVALRRQGSSKISAFLKDKNELILAEAARAIYDDFSIFESLPDLAKLINRDMSIEALWRRVLNSHLRQGQAENALALANFAADESKPIDQRLEAIAILEHWIQPKWNDRVNGRFRKVTKNKLDNFSTLVQPHVEKMLNSNMAVIQTASAQLSSKLNIKADPKTLLSWLKDDTRELKSRVDALKYLIGEKDYFQTVIEYSMSSIKPEIRATAASLHVKKDPARGMTSINTILSEGNNWEKQQAIKALASLDGKKSAYTLEKLFKKLIQGELSQDLSFELIEAAEKRDLAKQKDTYLNTLKKSDPKLGIYQPLMHGGDATLGKKIFNEHISAQCIRCHALGGVGSAVGPDLAGIGKEKSTTYLLESLIFPGNEIAKGFGITTVSLKNGKIVAGTLHDETLSDIQVKTPDGKITSISKSEIGSQTPAISMMPSMKGILSDAEIRNVIAYLTELK